MAGDAEPGPADALLTSVESVKRVTVAAACNRCRQRKAKCDGQRPCNECRRRNDECVFVANSSETTRQAQKRRFDEIAQDHSELQDLYQALATSSESTAWQLFQRIRAGDQPRALLRRIQYGSAEQPIHQSYQRVLRQQFLLAVIQSTASLHDAVNVAADVLATTRLSLPAKEAYRPLQNAIITLEKMSGLLDGANTPKNAIEHSRLPSELVNGSYDGPPFWVPAFPWTAVTDSDEAVSNIISLYLTFLNPYWRFIEEDLFLRGMRSRDLSSKYCSPVLVNGILACASLWSLHEAAFETPDNLLTRGDHFQREARRLWDLERGSESVSNLQGLLFLVMSIGYRGQDRQGFFPMPLAVQMSKSLLRAASHEHERSPITDDLRLVRCAAWATAYFDASMYTGMLTPTIATASFCDEIGLMDKFLPDKVEYFATFTFHQEPLPLRRNLLMRHRCILTRFIYEENALMINEDKGCDAQQQLTACRSMSKRLRDWYGALPTEMKYTKTVLPCLFDFHCQYICVQLTLCDLTAKAAFRQGTQHSAMDTSSHEPADLDTSIETGALQYAYQAATYASHYREQYGLKAGAPYVFQSSTISSFILLRDLQRYPDVASALLNYATRTPIRDSRTALEECFRCLLACGMHMILPRGVALTVYHTAKEMKVVLPEVIVSMIGMVADSVWRPAELARLESSYPNWAFVGDTEAKMDEVQMERALKKWQLLGISGQDEGAA